MRLKFQESGTFQKGDIVDLKIQNGFISIAGFEDSAIKSPDELKRTDYKGIVEDTEGDITVSVVRFSDLHRHSDNSLKDGMAKVPDIIKHTEYSGAITDHGNMYGFLEYYKGMLAAGKKPIIGFEAYAQDPIDDSLSRNHLILLAKNFVGYKNLLKLTSESFDHFYKVQHVTWAMLEKYHEGVICTSACLAGSISRYLNNDEYEKAKTIAIRFQKLFGDDYYLEIQRHGIKEEEKVAPLILKLGKELGIKVIATTDSHYVAKDDSYAHEILLCMQTKKTLSQDHMKFGGKGYHLHTSAEMEKLFYDVPEALDNTLDIADKCNVEIPLGDVNLPKFDIPKAFSSPLEYFKHCCKQGFQERFEGTIHFSEKKYLDRYDYELDMIEKMGFESYFLIVADFIKMARDKGIYVGPGRGSAAGSLLAYCLKITDLDPIKYNLFFERFLNPERVSWPDIDVDFEDDRREEVLAAITEKYGAENCCHIIAFGTMGAKMVIKDVSRVLGYPVSVGNTIAGFIPKLPKITITEAMAENPDFKRDYDSNPDTKKIVDIALKLEGGKRHATQHACGYVIAPGNVSDYMPVSMEKDEQTGVKGVTSQVTMTECEDLSLLKMDLLGLKNLSAIHETINSIRKTRGIQLDYHDIPLDDRKTYEFLASGNTGAVFQFESPGMTNVIRQMLDDVSSLPDERLKECYERLIAAVSLYRPGPMKYIDDYIEGMRNHDKIIYATPELESILSSTYGQIVYQEQVMRIVQKLAGYSLGRADLVRKAMGKKKQSVMDAEREVFIRGNHDAFVSGKDAKEVPGCVSNGISESVAIEVWDKMADFAKYAFNRSHAACYAYISVITAYLSCHFPEEFYAAMLNAFVSMPDKTKSYLGQAFHKKIKLLPPSINLSFEGYTAEPGAIRIGLRGLKDLGKTSPAAIVAERNKNGEFQSYQELLDRMNESGYAISKSGLESLIFSGALDCFGLTKASMIKGIEVMAKNLMSKKKAPVGQTSLFDMPEFEGYSVIDFPFVAEFSERTLVEKEYEYVGFYLTKHPVDRLHDFVAEDSAYLFIGELEEKAGANTKTVGVVKDLFPHFTKAGERMYSFKIEDRYDTVQCVIFPRNVPSNESLLENGTVVVVNGDFKKDEVYGNQIIVKTLLPESQILPKTTPVLSVVVHDKTEQDEVFEIVKKFPGDSQLTLVANGKTYYPKKTVNITPGLLEALSGFQVSANLKN